MPRPSALRVCIAVLVLLLPTYAFAQDILTVRAVNVRAGPDREFPLVTWLPARTPVHILGCVSSWDWCDISSGRSRGWVHSSYLGNFFRERTPVVTFSVEAYWDAHYRGRPWYASRDDWLAWGTPSFQAPPPSPPRWRR